MRWEDERYVRLYTRDTPEFLALSWQARGLFALILRKVDRAGVLAVGRLGLKGVAVAVGAPWADVESSLRELLDDGCLIFDSERSAVFLPNFLEAQEATQSDRARKQASRERARALFNSSTAAAESARTALGDGRTRRNLEARASGLGTVYFVGTETGDRVKIGFTSGDPVDRVRELQTSSPVSLNLLCSMSGSLADESALHARFEELRVAGEWFRLEGSLAELTVTIRDSMSSQHVTPNGHAESRQVTAGHVGSLCAVPSRAVLGGDHTPGDASSERTDEPEPEREPAKTAKTAKTGSTRGSRLSPDWEPKPEVLERFRTRDRVDASRCVERFKNYWLSSSGRNAVKADWDRAFLVWVGRDIDDGKLPKLPDELPLLRLPNRDELLAHDLANAPDMTGFSFGATK